MRITGQGVWGPPSDKAAAIRLLRRAVELGVNFIDTADSYGPEVSESLIAESLHPYPPGLVIATKGGLVRPGPDLWNRDARPKHLREACEGSLRRLRLQRIDLYQLHAPDPGIPLEDSIGELVRLQQEGKIQHIGVSNFGVSELKRAQKLAKVVSVQNRYNIEERRSDEVIAYCEHHSLAFIPWAPLGSGRYAMRSNPMKALKRIAERHRVSVGQTVIAWLLHRSPAMLPIPGTASIKHLEENVAAASLTLSDEDLRELD
jgi:aryl-alcohol dehydrogenase-like predicted oxidoreductase